MCELNFAIYTFHIQPRRGCGAFCDLFFILLLNPCRDFFVFNFVYFVFFAVILSVFLFFLRGYHISSQWLSYYAPAELRRTGVLLRAFPTTPPAGGFVGQVCVVVNAHFLTRFLYTPYSLLVLFFNSKYHLKIVGKSVKLKNMDIIMETHIIMAISL